MRAGVKATSIGVALGVAAIAALTPSLASGNARTELGSGRAVAAVARPLIAQLADALPGTSQRIGRGAAAVTIEPASGEVCADLRVTNLTSTQAHLHRGAEGENGPPVVDFSAFAPNPTSAACVTVAPSLAAEILANPSAFYVDAHIPELPSGTARGQLGSSRTVTGAVHLLQEPLRAYDSRNIVLPSDPPRFAPIKAGDTRTIGLATEEFFKPGARIAVPPGAVAAMIRVTVDQTVGAGWLKVYSASLETPPATATVNWYEPGAIVGADATVAVDAQARIKVTAGVSTTHFVIDVVGYVY